MPTILSERAKFCKKKNTNLKFSWADVLLQWLEVPYLTPFCRMMTPPKSDQMVQMNCKNKKTFTIANWIKGGF